MHFTLSSEMYLLCYNNTLHNTLNNWLKKEMNMEAEGQDQMIQSIQDKVLFRFLQTHMTICGTKAIYEPRNRTMTSSTGSWETLQRPFTHIST